MKDVLKNILFALVIFIVLVSLFSGATDFFKKEKVISLSELAGQVKENQVKKAVISGNKVSLTLADNSLAVVYKEPAGSFLEALKNLGADEKNINALDIQVKTESGFGYFLINILPVILPFLLILLFFWFMFRQAKSGQTQAFSFGASQAKLFDPTKEKTTFKDVAGAYEAKEELKEVVEFLKSPEKFLNMGAKIPRGVILIGAPGTGKTLMARAVAGEANVPYFHISGSEFVEMFVGVGASRVRDLFRNAKKHAPAIVFIDEIDAVGRHRGAGLGGGHDEREQTLNQILVEMDGFERDTNIIVIAATNRPDILDPALLRPGRFDRRVVIDEPDIKNREEILKIHGLGKPLDQTVNLRKIAERTPGFSGADLANLMNEAAILAARRNQKEITQTELAESIEKVMLGPERRSKVYSPKEKEIVAFHEAGHALVASFLPEADPVHKISIISRGRAGGYTLKLPSEEINFYSKTKFMDELATLLGGYAAEKTVFSDVTTGPCSDLKIASDLARRIVTEYGMSEKMGPITFGDKERLVFLGKELSEHRNYSENVAAKIDDEVAKFIDKAYKTALKIVKEKRNALNKIAAVLIEKETIEQREFEELMKGFQTSGVAA
ncbi:MAG: ATP-dependent zinc metalloprotease FtsH [Candidatus Sungbacteria bacterium]|uniref:ATP-dependent zinc metalloprotease FtsH n=1 Tax=Candidatus Sungiibacteriota bacterium TaxID=2750080 RepID=A0A932DSQ5_9BACT|nr:ATP-dependent zinc metalloprotease FtsH [Candidatus Sungbacteria bacterium]